MFIIGTLSHLQSASLQNRNYIAKDMTLNHIIEAINRECNCEINNPKKFNLLKIFIYAFSLP